MQFDFSTFSHFITAPFLFKISFLFVLFLYIIFTLIIFNQIRSMDQLISEIHSSIIIRAISLIGIVAAISLFLAAVVIL